MKSFKQMVVELWELENLDVIIKKKFAFSACHIWEAKEDIGTDGSVIGLLQELYKKSRKMCHHYVKKNLVHQRFDVNQTFFEVFQIDRF